MSPEALSSSSAFRVNWNRPESSRSGAMGGSGAVLTRSVKVDKRRREESELGFEIWKALMSVEQIADP